MRVSGSVCSKKAGETGGLNQLSDHQELDGKPQRAQHLLTEARQPTGYAASVGRVRCNGYNQSLRLDIERNQWCQQHEGSWDVRTVHVDFLFMSRVPGEALPQGRNAGLGSFHTKDNVSSYCQSLQCRAFRSKNLFHSKSRFV